ncbi:MAG: hypothetical protein QW308_01650 [Candidatus Woesearchaeota archaeon]
MITKEAWHKMQVKKRVIKPSNVPEKLKKFLKWVCSKCGWNIKLSYPPLRCPKCGASWQSFYGET